MSTFLIVESDTSILPTVRPYPGRTCRTPEGTTLEHEYAVWGLDLEWYSRTSRADSHFRELEHRHGGQFTRLNNNRVSGSERRCNLLEGYEKRMVEGLHA